MNSSTGYYGNHSQSRVGRFDTDDFYNRNQHRSSNARSQGTMLLDRGSYRDGGLRNPTSGLESERESFSMKRAYGTNYWDSNHRNTTGGGGMGGNGGGSSGRVTNVGRGSYDYRNRSLMSAPPAIQSHDYGGYRNDYQSRDDYLRYDATRFFNQSADYRYPGGYSLLSHEMNHGRMERNEHVFGYLGIQNLRKGKSGLFVINYLNYLLKSRLLYNGPPVVFNARLNDNNLEAVFPGSDVLRAVVEKLSPIMVKGDILVYVTYKPPNIPGVSLRMLAQSRRLQRPFPGRRPVTHVAVTNARNTGSASNAQQGAKTRKNKLKPPRLRGVFPDGVMPKKVVVVADDQLPYLSLDELRKAEREVLSGSNLDMAGFLHLIHSDHNIKTDGVLYVVVPSLVFLFNKLEAFALAMEDFPTDGPAETVDAPSDSTTSVTAQGMPDALNGLSLEDKSEKVKAAVEPGKPKSASNKQPRKGSLLQEVVNDFPQLLSALDRDFLSKAVAHTGKTVPDNRSGLARVFARQLLHSALHLRAAVRASTENCEVVFCGFPAHYMDGSQAAAALASLVPPGRATQLTNAVVAGLRTFNDFAVNSWMLGGFKISSFNDASLHSSPEGDGGSSQVAETAPGPESQVPGTAGCSLQLEPSAGGALFSLRGLAHLPWLEPKANLTVVSGGYTDNVCTALQRVANFQLHKGGFAPWGPVEAAEFEHSSLPDIVAQSIEDKIFTHRWDAASAQTLYYCTECKLSVGTVAGADAHAYTRKHFNSVRRLVQQRAKQGGPKKSVLVGSMPPNKAIPLSKDYLSKMANFKVVKVLENDAGPRYQCLVCDITRANNFDDTSLRFHVHHYRHRLALNSALGLPSHRALVCQHENWSLVQQLQRHPAMDVVLVADERHRSSLHSLASDSDRVHLLLLPGLLHDSLAAMTALSAGQQATGGRPALWLIVAGADLLLNSELQEQQDVDQLLSPVVSLQVFLRVRLPVSCAVVTAPLLPLLLLSDLLPHSSTGPLMAASNALSVPKQQLSVVSALYKTLHARCHDLHRATALHSNLHRIHTAAVKLAHFNTVQSVAALPALATTAWHVALQAVITATTFAAPAVFLRPYDLDEPNVEDLELDAKIQHVVIVGPDAKCKKGPRYESTIELTMERELTFQPSDIEWMVSAAKVREEGNYVAWYLTCPFPGILFDAAESGCCQAQGCTEPLSVWRYRGPHAVNEALLQINRFVVQLQSKMPHGNVVTLLPVFPSTMVTSTGTDALTHSAMHSLCSSQPNVSFSEESEQLLSIELQALRQGWADLFYKTNVHYTTRFSRDLLAQLDAREINRALTSLKADNKQRAKDWINVLNSLLKNYASRLSAELSDVLTQQLGLKEEAASRPADKVPEALRQEGGTEGGTEGSSSYDLEG